MKNAIDPQKNFKKWLEANQEAVTKFLVQNSVSVRDLGLEHRICNILESNGLHSLSDIVWLSTVKLRKIDFIGRNEAEKIVLATRYYLRSHIEELLAFCQKENLEASASSNELVSKAEAEFSCQKEDSDFPFFNDDFESAAETEPEKVAFEFVAVKSVFDIVSEKFDREITGEILELPIDVLTFSNHTFNFLQSRGIHTIGDLLKSHKHRFSHVKYFRNNIKELVAFFQKEDASLSASNDEAELKAETEIPYQKEEPEYLALNGEAESKAETESGTGSIGVVEDISNFVLEKFGREVTEETLFLPIDILDLSNRSYNTLMRSGFQTVGAALKAQKDGLNNIRNLGAKSIEEIEEKLDLFLKKSGEEFSAVLSKANEKPLESLPESNAPFTFDEIMESTMMKKECVAFFEENVDCFIFSQIPFSVRAKNTLSNHSVHQLSDLIKLYPDGFLSIKNLGIKTLKELHATVKNIVEANIGAISYFIQQTDAWMGEKILRLIQSDGFRGYSFEQIKNAVPAISDEDRIKKVVGSLLSRKLIEYVDFRCYPVYPSFSEVLKSVADKLTEREMQVLKGRLLEGKTLEEIGTNLSLTRERVRQIFLKANRKIKNLYLEKSEFPHYDEEYYEYLFTNYSVGKDFWTDFLKLPQSTLSFLKNFCTAGALSLEEVENDPNLDLNLKIKIQNYLDRGKLKINGEMINGERAALEDYALKLLCRDEMIWDDFCAAYNKMLSENKIPFDEKLYITNENSITRKNRIREAKQCLWKYGSKLRYYDMEAQDYSELLEGIGFPQYDNTAISTLKWFQEYPELMEKYDIRDHYELHNLLKKTIDPKTYPEVSFDHQPCITFGNFDREKTVFEIIKTFSPITAEELLEFLYSEYGFEQGTAWNCCKPFMQLYHQGVFRMEFKSIPAPCAELLVEKLTDEFYFISEIEKIYDELFPEADLEEINPHSLKVLGLNVMSNYVLKNHETAESFFEDLLTREDVYSLESIQRRFGSIQMYNQTYRRMRENHDIFLFENDQIITLNRLQKVGITKEDVLEFCESVLDFVDEEQMFTIHSLRREGFETKLDDLGFDDSFYNGILAMYPSFVYQRVFHGIVLMKGTCGMLSKKQFILSMLSKYDSIDMDEFMDDVEGDYGIRISDRYEVTSAIQGTDFYYSDTMNKIYRNKELYYEEMED